MGIVCARTSALSCSKYLHVRQHSVVMSSKLNFTTGTLKHVVRTTLYVVTSRGEIHFTSEDSLQEGCQVTRQSFDLFYRNSALELREQWKSLERIRNKKRKSLENIRNEKRFYHRNGLYLHHPDLRSPSMGKSGN